MKHFFTLSLLCLTLVMTGCTSSPQPSPEEVTPVDSVVPQDEENVEDGVNLATALLFGNGTEPFWNFVASGTSLTWSEPSMAGPVDITSYPVTITQSGTTIYITNPSIQVLMQVQACSDGMSEALYTYTATITKGVQTFNGCANVTP